MRQQYKLHSLGFNI